VHADQPAALMRSLRRALDRPSTIPAERPR
jgi:hypothetical protein